MFGRVNPPGLVYTIDLSKIADRANPRTVEAPIGGEIQEPTVIDWGDGSSEVISSGTFPEHTYAEGAGDVFTVTLRSATGHLPFCYFALEATSTDTPSGAITFAVTSIDHFAGWLGAQTPKSYGSGVRNTRNLKYCDPRIVGLSRWTTLNGTFMTSGIAQRIDSFCFDFATNCTLFGGVFQYCASIHGSIPEGLFDNNTAATSFANFFNGCSGLTGSIPADLFKYNTSVTTFTSLFLGCSGLTGSIPPDLFKHTISVTNFSSCFNGCSGLTGSIPADLFKYNTSVTQFTNCFKGCSGLNGSIPSDLFDSSASIINYIRYLFDGCSGLTGAPYVFWDSSLSVDSQKFPALANAITTDPNAIGSVYSGCSSAMRAQVPTAFGGTMKVS